jgi:sugar lactone lactonase YvrE
MKRAQLRPFRWLIPGLAALAAGAGCDDDAGDPGTPPPQPACAQTSGNICTVAGTGVAGDGEDGRLPRQTMLYSPADIAFSPQGALAIVDWNNHRIRLVQPDGTLKIVAGLGELAEGLLVDAVGNRLNHPTDVTFDAQGRMVIAAWHNSRIKRVDLSTGSLVLEDIAGSGARSYSGDGGPADKCDLNLPASVVFDPQGNLFISDQANQRIRRIDAGSKIITTVAGTGKPGFSGDGGPALEATFNLPVGQQGHPAAHITRDTDGSLYLADTLNNRIRRVGPDGMVSTVAGKGTFGTSGDGGPAIEAELAQPVDVAIGPDGALYLTDTENNCVRKVAGGVISTVAGTCRQCGPGLDDPCRCPSQLDSCTGDGGPARAANLKRPTGIAFDAAGNLYIADTLNHRIRVVYR